MFRQPPNDRERSEPGSFGFSSGGMGAWNIVSQTPGLVVAQEWSPYVADTKDLIGDWRPPMSCGAFNVVTGKCGSGGKAG